MPNVAKASPGGPQGVLQHFYKLHQALNVKIRALKVLPGADKKPPNFMTFLNHAGIEKQQSNIMDSLNRAVLRGDKWLRPGLLLDSVQLH